ANRRRARAEPGAARGGGRRRPAVDRVADGRRADVGHVHADLVRAAGLELDLAMRVRAEALEHAIARPRLAPAVDDGHARALARVPADRSVDAPAAGQHTLADRLIT